MRKTFIETLIELAKKDKNIYLLSGDLGFSVLEPFIKKFPKRFINCGVAEQNMIGVAAGLALSGKKPYVYSIIPFVTMRCFEQIRNDICYQDLDVKIIGVGAGFSYGYLGATHHAIEDMAILRTLPNMTVLCPADIVEVKELMRQSYKVKKPIYIRLAKKGELLHKSKLDIKLGKPSFLKRGNDGLIVVCGVQASFCVEIAKELQKKGKRFGIISFHTLKPVDKESFLKEIREIKKIFSIEEHSVIGGLGGALAEILAESDWRGQFKIIGVPDKYSCLAGSTDFYQKLYSLDKENIIKTILKK